MSHARFAPSAASRWLHCPASIPHCEDAAKTAPPRSSPYAELGSWAHRLAQHLLTTSQVPTATLRILVGTSFQGHLITQDIVDSLAVYLGEIARIKNLSPDGEEFIEQRVELDLAAIYAPATVYGTADWIYYCHETGDLYVLDYKHGSGILVDAKDNPQLMIYGAGAVELMTDRGWHVTNVHAGIVQPRYTSAFGPVRWISYGLTQLFDFTYTTIRDAVDKVVQGPPYDEVIGDHCKWCGGVALCTAHQRQLEETIKDAFGENETAGADVINQDYDLVRQELDQISRAISVEEQIVKYFASLKQRARDLAHAGHLPPGYRLTPRLGNRRWVGDQQQIMQALRSEGLSDSDFTSQKLLSPRSVIKLLDDPSHIEAYITRDQLDPIFVPTESPLPEFKGEWPFADAFKDESE